MKGLSLILLCVVILVACKPADGVLTPIPATTSQTATQAPTAPPTVNAITATPSASSGVDLTRTAIASLTFEPLLTPTQEFCENVPIEYIVIADALRVRTGAGTRFNQVSPGFERGDTFIGNLCSDPVDGFYWTKIIEHLVYAGNWTALGVVNGPRYLE